MSTGTVILFVSSQPTPRVGSAFSYVALPYGFTEALLAERRERGAAQRGVRGRARLRIRAAMSGFGR